MCDCIYMLLHMYGSFLKQVRTSRGMTQAQLAANVGISQPNLSAYENDRRMPSLDIANRILVACGYELVADGGSRRIDAPLPKAGWFPDDDVPPRLPDDPDDEEPTIDASTSAEERASLFVSMVELADAIR